MIVLKQLDESRWKDHRDLRLEALKREPTAFGSSYNEEKNISEAEWRRRMKNALFAFSEDKLIGMIGYFCPNLTKIQHIANIYGFYVINEYRGQGVGTQLINSMLTQIKKDENIVKIKLSVNPKQQTAVKIYQNCGFKIVGRMKKELYVNGKFYDEVIMEILL